MITRCEACPRNYSPLPSSGPTRASIMLCGERPGKMEMLKGEVFVGPTGQELDETYLRLAGLHRDELRVTNVVACYADSNRTPSDREVDSCARHFLPHVLKECQPEIVVLMGGRACRIADRKLKIDTHHGLPYYGSILNGTWEGMIWPSYHPALGMHDTSKMSQLLEDFEHLGDWLAGKWTPTTADVESSTPPDYRLVTTQRQLDEYLDCMAAVLDMGTDTENHGPAPWSIQFSHTPRTGRMILAKDTKLVRSYAEWLRASSTTSIFHNAPHDLDVAAKMGITFNEFRDTQQESFHQGSLPQGLKPLAYRLLGVEMRSWEEIVWPDSIHAVTNWMEDAISLASASLQDCITHPLKQGKCGECGHRHSKGKCKCGCGSTRLVYERLEQKPGAVESILKHVLGYTIKTEEADDPYNPWNKLAEMKMEGLRGKRAEEWEWEWLEEELGEMPILGIGNCSEHDALMYATGDADHTLQVAQALEGLRGGGRWQIAEGDEDQ